VITELDGGQHANAPRDRVRDVCLAADSYRVLRVWNYELTIWAELQHQQEEHR
jgi:very-short-patch-repair endonuclease